MPGPVGLAVGVKDVGAEAVKQRGGQLFVAEDLDPLGEREVGGGDRGALLVAVGEQVEEQFAASPVEGHEAAVVDDQQRDTQVALMQAGERPLVARLDQFVDEVGGPDEGDPLAVLDGLDPECDREMGLAGAERSGEDVVLAALDVLADGELGELQPLDPAQHIPVELIRGLEVGESGPAQEPSDGAIAANQDLGFEQLRQEHLVVPAVMRGLSDQLRVLATDRGQLQFAAAECRGRKSSRANITARWMCRASAV